MLEKNTYKEGMPIKGRLEMDFRNRETGEILEEHGQNMIVSVGMEQIMKAFTQPPSQLSPTQFTLDGFKLGDDIGDGTLLAPESAKIEDTAGDQNPVWSVPYNQMYIEYPNYYTTEVKMVLDGDDIMQSFPTQVDLRFSSAALYSGSGEVFAFRRFPTRTITREITIDVRWVIYFDGQNT